MIHCKYRSFHGVELHIYCVYRRSNKVLLHMKCDLCSLGLDKLLYKIVIRVGKKETLLRLQFSCIYCSLMTKFYWLYILQSYDTVLLADDYKECKLASNFGFQPRY